MGYPMTYRRFVSRNGLGEGGYDHSGKPLPVQWAKHINTTHPGIGTPEGLRDVIWPLAVDRLHQYEVQVAMLLGDLRRLEEDTVDEGPLCAMIAQKAGVDKEVVAAVLQAWLAT